MSHSRFRKSALAAAVLSLGFSMGALAQDSAGSSASGTPSSATGTTSARSTTGSGGIARSDRRFLEEAYMGSMAEVRLGKLAQDKASSQEVKDFGRRMVDDHNREIERLSKIAGDEGVQLPSQLDRKHQKTYDRLSKLSGAGFDRAYMKEMTSDHGKDVSEYEKAAKSARNEALRQHAQQEIPTLREHEKLAQSTMEDVKKGSTVSMRGESSGSSRSSSNRAASAASNR